MKQFRFFLENGRSFVVTCENATFVHDDTTGMLTDFKLEGVTRNNPEFLDASAVVAVVALGRSGDANGKEE